NNHAARSACATSRFRSALDPKRGPSARRGSPDETASEDLPARSTPRTGSGAWARDRADDRRGSRLESAWPCALCSGGAGRERSRVFYGGGQAHPARADFLVLGGLARSRVDSGRETQAGGWAAAKGSPPPAGP